jgi:YHS domain-containing protein
MTAERQESRGKRFNAVFCGRIVLIAVLAVPAPPAEATTSERVVVNRFSGLAIEGFDPVAYFVNRQPLRGLPEFEASQGGAVWRFHNEGNRASFVAHPEVYGPQFGGYDPIDIARGVVFAGNPLFWVVSGNRLYLFGLETNRDAFAANPERFLAQARARWLELEETLAR